MFECVKLFEVEESQPTAEEEIPIHDIGTYHLFELAIATIPQSEHLATHFHTDSDTTPSSIGIDLCCWREVSDYSMLVLFCNNGVLFIYSFIILFYFFIYYNYYYYFFFNSF